MQTIKVFLLFIPIIWLPVFAKGQVRVTGQEGDNPISVAVPFVSFAPDSRGSGLGDAGVATSPDAQSIHWNNAKLAFY